MHLAAATVGGSGARRGSRGSLADGCSPSASASALDTDGAESLEAPESPGRTERAHAFNVLYGFAASAHGALFGQLGPLQRVLMSMLESIVAVVALTVIGTAIFSRLERDEFKIIDSEYLAVLAEVRANVTEDVFERLQQFIVVPPNHDVWALSTQSSYLFSFTVITSIGYGVIVPTTPGGQIFFCFYALVSIPIAGLSFGRVAAAVVDLMSWAHACRRRIIRESFARADKEAHGWITHEAMHDAIAHAQHCTVDVVEFEAILKEIDPRDEGRFNLRLYAWAFTQLGTLDQRVNEKRQRVQLTAFCFAVWNIVGMIVFHFLEHWTWVESIYFCFETLLTIGLGDFVPRSANGSRFQFLFCCFGLGLLASLVSAFDALSAATENVARVAQEASARQRHSVATADDGDGDALFPFRLAFRRLAPAPAHASGADAAHVAAQHWRVAAHEAHLSHEAHRADETPPPRQRFSDHEEASLRLGDGPAAEEIRAALLAALQVAGADAPAARVEPSPPPPELAPAAPAQEVAPPVRGPVLPPPLPLPPAEQQPLRAVTPPGASPPWFASQPPPGSPPPLQLPGGSGGGSGLVPMVFMGRGADERDRARAERAARVAAARRAQPAAEQDAAHAAIRHSRRMPSPHEWSDA